MGDLKRLLNQGEYAFFGSAPMLESRFVQINRRGELINLHNRPTFVTIGICAARSPMPSGMLLAHKVPVSPQEIMANLQKFSENPSQVEQLALSSTNTVKSGVSLCMGTAESRPEPLINHLRRAMSQPEEHRFLPLKFVELSVHSTDKKQLLLKLVNGRSYYLELCAPPDQQEQLFHHWLKLISLLRHPKDTSNTNVNIICKDSGTSHEKAPSPNNSPDNSNNSQNMPNPKTEEETVTEQTSSNQVLYSDSMGSTEKSEKERATFNSSQEATRLETTTQSKGEDPLDTINTKSKERRKIRTDKMKQKKEKTPQPSGNRKSGSKSSIGCFKLYFR